MVEHQGYVLEKPVFLHRGRNRGHGMDCVDNEGVTLR